MSFLTIYASLFGVSFLAATLLPAQSETVLFWLLMTGAHPIWLLVLVASAGNVLGSCVNWFLGTMLARREGKRWFPIRREKLARAERWYGRYGRWTLLLSWLPVVGDPLTLVAGVLRERFVTFVLLVAAAKTGRYLVVVAVQQGFFT